MRRSKHSRTSGRQQALGDLFAPDILEGDQTPGAADAHFPLRPFAGEIPRAAGVDPHAEAPESPAERLLRLARVAVSGGRRAEAAGLFQDLLALEPSHLAGRLELAQLQEHHGQEDEAYVNLSEAVRLHPDRPHALVARGAFLARIKRHPEAEADLHRALRLAPDDAGVHFELGFALWRKGLASEAAEHLRRASELAPERADAAHYLGESLHQLGDDLGALAALERSATLGAGNPKPLQLMGRVLDRMGRPEEAREMYRRAREAAPR
ncbi:MAG: tetratricopeptide repeat protein [Gemmatimonadales bacterium]|jgi:tetratricopeptide (TPR) repeat protein|nr:MAG: tetratricopeptide repeat protein [Gemmatimonadales bacterium]